MSVASALFFLLVTSMWIGMHWWVGHRQIHRGRAYPAWARRMIWGGVALLASVPLLALAGRRLGLPIVELDALHWVGFSLMGVSSLLICFTLAVEIPRLFAEGALALRRRAVAREREQAADDAPASSERRRFFADVVNFGIVGGATGLSAAGFAAARRVPEVVEVRVPVADLHPDLEGLRIVQLSDVHVGPTIRGAWLEQVIEVVNTLDADLVALTGDFVDGQVAELAPEVSALGRIRATHGAFFVTGNHEYYWDGPAWCAAIESFGPTVLNNEHRCIEVGAARLLVAGVPDMSAGGRVGHASDPQAARAGAPEHDFSLLLAHQPRSVFAAAKAGFDLQLSGHTHAGQYFPMSVLIHLFQPYVSGLNRHEGMQIYVSRGTGYWGPPNRAGSPSEITLLTLERG
ncbi:MAG: metallophosphoesterase [Enhygromyxa sp.]